MSCSEEKKGIDSGDTSVEEYNNDERVDSDGDGWSVENGDCNDEDKRLPWC